MRHSLKGVSRVTITLLLLFVSTGIAWAQELSGSGTKSDPFLITSADDWILFAANVNNGQAYKNQYIKLTADLTGITTMVGTKTRYFCGVFNGDGHTIDLDITGTGEYTAPLRFVNNAIIYNLNTTGTVNGKGYMRATGIVGYAGGKVSLVACRSSVTIISDINGNGSHGGLLGKSEGILTFTDCLFDGKFYAPTAWYCGGLLGWRETGTVVFNNCLMAATEMICGTDYSGTFYQQNKSGHTLNNCYYKTAFGEKQGTQTDATGAELAALLGDGWEVQDGNAVPKKAELNNLELATISGMDYYQMYTSKPLNPEFDVIFLTDTLVSGTHYTTSFTDSTGNTVPYPVERGIYKLTITAITGSGYHGTLSTAFEVVGLKTDAQGDWLIESAEDWKQFLIMTDNLEYSYYNHIVKLTQDISIGRMAIADDLFTFSGIFDGGGHTINFDLTVNEDELVAPFPMASNATINRLNTTGNITCEAADFSTVAGITGYASGTININSCHSSIIVSQSDTTFYTFYSGFIGYSYNSDITINNCLFDGKIEAPGNGIGGFISSLGRTKCHITNSLMAGTLICDTAYSGVFYNPDNDAEVYLSNCYYTNDFQQAQGTRTSASGNELRALLGDGWTVSNGHVIPVTDDKNLATAFVFGIEDYFAYTGSAIDLSYALYSMSMEKLTPGTHYTVQIRNSNGEITDQVTEKGTYTIIFTGKGDYYGTRSVSFFVDNCPEGLTIDARYKEGDPEYYYATIPATDTTRITLSDDLIKSFKVYDIWGYGTDRGFTDGMLLVTVPEGYCIKVTGCFSYDWFDGNTLAIYEGNDFDSELYHIILGSGEDYVDVGTIYSTANSILIYYYSEYPSTQDLNLTIKLVEASEPHDITVLPSSNGKLETDKNIACVNTIVNLTASPDQGYILDSIFVTADDGSRINVEGGHWYNNNATFHMYESAVNAQAKFIPANSEVSVLMPFKPNGVAVDTVYLTDARVTSFKVYDNGGKDGNYLRNNDSYLVLHAPEGYVFKLTGTMVTEITKKTIWDYLCIYDGDSQESPLLADTLYSTQDCRIIDIGTIYTTGQDMMLYFHSDEYTVAEGLDFTVTLVSAEEMATVPTPRAATESTDWYLLNGRKLIGAPTPGTIYLQSGRKILLTQ